MMVTWWVEERFPKKYYYLLPLMISKVLKKGAASKQLCIKNGLIMPMYMHITVLSNCGFSVCCHTVIDISWTHISYFFWFIQCIIPKPCSMAEDFFYNNSTQLRTTSLFSSQNKKVAILPKTPTTHSFHVNLDIV